MRRRLDRQHPAVRANMDFRGQHFTDTDLSVAALIV